MKAKFSLQLFVGVVLLSAQVVGQEKLSLTVDDCVQIGLARNKALRASFLNVQANEAKASEMKTAGLPSLKFSGSYAHLSDVPPFVVNVPFAPPGVSTFTISPTILDTYSFRFTLQQPLFTGAWISQQHGDCRTDSADLQHGLRKRQTGESLQNQVVLLDALQGSAAREAYRRE